MLFNSYIFLLLFLPISLALYFFFNKKGWHKIGLLTIFAMSIWFYAYNNVNYSAILLFSIACNWTLSRLMLKKRKAKKGILILGIFINVAVIFYFKYFNFFVWNVNWLFHTSYIVEKILLPLGISFYTFQQISFMVDSYRGETADYNILEYAVFVSFFPQLIAGPIVLHGEMIPQFRDESRKRFSHSNFAEGFYKLTMGLLKKVIIADTLGEAVNWGFANTDVVTSLEMILISLSYTFQIYFDFSGYSDMAIGIGKMFNIDIPINFNSPYKSYSIIEFWRRWHLTLTRFLKNYIYIPLGGSRKGKIRTYVNIFLVFLISGIWHGANWTFILWGVIHGVSSIVNRIFRQSWDKCNAVFRWICTFSFVNITWLIFRSDSIQQAFMLIKKMLSLDSCWLHPALKNIYLSQSLNLNVWVLLAIAFVVVLNMKNLHEKVFRPTLGKALLTTAAFIWVITSFSGVSIFLYFNF